MKRCNPPPRRESRSPHTGIIAIMGLLCLPAFVIAAPSPILERAARVIEAHRKVDATIRIVRNDGSPVPQARIEVIQRTHDFAFGNVFRPRHYHHEQYRTRFLDIFNYVQLLEFNWGQYETDEGKPKLADRLEFINGWCREHGLQRFYGHMLVWSPQMDEPYGPEIPCWVFRYDRSTQDRLLKERVTRVLPCKTMNSPKTPEMRGCKMEGWRCI